MCPGAVSELLITVHLEGIVPNITDNMSCDVTN